MASIHRATVRPSKVDLLAAWLPAQPWGPVNANDLAPVGAYRFEDPDGQVGLETHLVRVADSVWHVPLTYRDEPLPGAGNHLVGRMHHSVLGERWVYDGCADPAYIRMLAATTLTGVGQSVEVVEEQGRSTLLPPTVRLSGGGWTGAPIEISGFRPPTRDEDAMAVLRSTVLELRLYRRPRSTSDAPYVVRGAWAGQTDPLVLATASPLQ